MRAVDEQSVLRRQRLAEQLLALGEAVLPAVTDDDLRPDVRTLAQPAPDPALVVETGPRARARPTRRGRPRPECRSTRDAAPATAQSHTRHRRDRGAPRRRPVPSCRRARCRRSRRESFVSARSGCSTCFAQQCQRCGRPRTCRPALRCARSSPRCHARSSRRKSLRAGNHRRSRRRRGSSTSVSAALDGDGADAIDADRQPLSVVHRWYGGCASAAENRNARMTPGATVLPIMPSTGTLENASTPNVSTVVAIGDRHRHQHARRFRCRGFRGPVGCVGRIAASSWSRPRAPAAGRRGAAASAARRPRSVPPTTQSTAAASGSTTRASRGRLRRLAASSSMIAMAAPPASHAASRR